MAFALTSIGAPTSRRISLARFIALAFETKRQRRALANLDANTRHDLGLSQEQINVELARPVWDVPQSWLR